MNREPDWESLSEINFLMYRRMNEQLTTALSALEPAADEDPNQARAGDAVSSALHMYTAWANLIRHKAGETPLTTGKQEFNGRDLLNWIATTLQLSDIPEAEADFMLKGNRAMLQEALALLQSCAHTLGPGVRVLVEKHPRGFWFRVRYHALSDPPPTLDELLANLRANWRVQSAAFELRSARDFLQLNNTELYYSVQDRDCELSFFAWFVQQPTGSQSPREKARALLDAFNTDDTYQVITD
ncbi:MAG: hypothetical protein K8J31_07085 [Anaerolineae bacterium]|nr:hypothetical protein [Anaerolineae bacterium]